jgi:hypothetical protein
LFSQSSSLDAVSIWVEVRKVYSLGVDVLAATETCQNLGATVAHAACAYVEEIVVVGLQRVADVAERRAVPQDDLPVGAHARQQPPVELWAAEPAAGQRDDAPVPLAHVAQVERFAELRFQAVDQVSRGSGSPLIEPPAPDRSDAARAE